MPTNFRNFILLFTSSLLLFTLFDFLAGAPMGVNEPMSLGLWAAVTVQFLFWLLSMRAWGMIIGRWINLGDSPAGVSLAIGSLFYALLAMGLAAAGLLRPELRYFLFILQSLAIAWVPAVRIRFEKPVILAALPLCLLFSLNLLDSFFIHPYWDPLHHHLVGVRMFWEFGEMYFPTENIAAYQEGGFEMLFLWPHFYFAKAGGLGLLPVQVFGQLTHSVLGFGGSLLIAHSLALRWLPQLGWRMLAVTSFAVPASLHFAIPTAKNDWGIILWLLAGFWLLATISPEQKRDKLRGRIALAGLFWGYAWLSKLSATFAIAGLASILLFVRLSPKEFIILGLGFFAGAFPLAFRNYGATGNPLFPLLPDFFATKANAMGPTWREALAAYQNSPGRVAARFREFFTEFPLAPGALLAVFFAFKRKCEPELRAAGLAIAVGFLLFALLAGKATEMRLLGAVLPLAAMLLVVVMNRLTSVTPFRGAYLPWALLATLAMIIPYRWSALQRMPAIPYADLLTRNYVSGESQGWFRDHFKPGMRAALLVETRIYHSLPLPMIRPWDSPLLDTRLRTSKSGAEFVKILREEGFTHLILSQEKLDLFYPKELVGMVEAYVLPQENTFLFKSPLSLVADLRLLAANEEKRNRSGRK